MKLCRTCRRCYEDADASCLVAAHGQLTSARPGTRLLAGKYQLDRLLGRGGMGAVYAGTHLELERAVAIKLLLPDSVSDPQALERFRREARAAARLNHPNVANTYDYGSLANGEAYLIMELVHGQTLREYLNAEGRLSIAVAVGITWQVAEGISAAHHFDIVHRDLKPSNLMLTRDHRGALQAKVLDFGIAKLREHTTTSNDPLTAAGALIGTPRYMSPEQCAGLESDARSDIYSLAVILFEMLAGRPPFDAPSATAIALKHVRETPPDIVELRPDTPPALSSLVEQSLAKDPPARPQTAAAFAGRLHGIKVELQSDEDAPAAGEAPAEESLASTSEMLAAPTGKTPVEARTFATESAADTHLHAAEKPTSRAGEPTSDESDAAQAEDAARPLAEIFPPTETLTPVAASPDLDAHTGSQSPVRVASQTETATLVRPSAHGSLQPGRARRSLPLPLILGGLALAALLGILFFALRRPTAHQATAEPARPVPSPVFAPVTQATPTPTTPAPRPTPPPTVEPPAAAPEQEHAALRSSLDSWLAAHNSRNLSQVTSFYTPHLSTFYLSQNASRAAVRAEKARLFAESALSLTRTSDPQITFGRDGRTATMSFRKSYLRGDAARPQRGEVLQEIVWRKTTRGWKIHSERDLRVLR